MNDTNYFDYLEEFTEEERHLIDSIYKRKFENLTPEEAELLVRWNNAQTLMGDRREEMRRASEEQTAALIADSEAVRDAAISSIEALTAAALQRYEDSRS